MNEKQVGPCQWSGLAPLERGASGPEGAGHESSTRQLAKKKKKKIFSVRKFGLYQQSLTALEHASIISPSIRSPHGSANGYASMETYLLFALYLLRASDRSSNFGTRSRSSYERAAELKTFVTFLSSCCQAVYQVKKKKYSTANYSIAHTTKKQYHTALNSTSTKINNSTTVPLYIFLTATTSTYNSKTAVQYRMTPIYNSTLTTVQYRRFTDPLL